MDRHLADGRDVYIAFNSTASYIASSHDFGASFSAPIKTNSDLLYWFAEGGAVAPGGTILFSESAEQDAKSPTGPIKLAVVSSTNGGASWTTTFVDTSQQQPPCPGRGCPADFYGAQAALAVDAAGTVMVAYAKSIASVGPMSLYEITSTDGVHWSAPVALGSGGTAVGADFRAVASGPGRPGTSGSRGWTTATAPARSTCGTGVRRTPGAPGV